MMVWNVLWLTAVAAAAALAGFCMGRLSMQQVEGLADETDGDRSGKSRSVWEASAAGKWRVQADIGTLEADSESPWIRMADHIGRESVASKDPRGRVIVGVGRRIFHAGTEDRAGSEVGAGSEDRAGSEVRAGSEDRAGSEIRAGSEDRAGSEVGAGSGVRAGSEDRAGSGVGAEIEVREGFRPSTVRSWNERLESVRRGTSSRFLRTGRRISGGKEQQIAKGLGRVVGSPVTGLVVSYKEGEHPAVQLSPLEDKLYAPANGKVIKIFPMGNAFLFRTEFGTELYIRAGDVKDDLLGRYFRSRVVQNEIVNKGKLLLEFDRMGLKAEGASFAVTISVENHTYGSNVTMIAKEQVRPGEEIMRVQEKYFPEKNVIER